MIHINKFAIPIMLFVSLFSTIWFFQTSMVLLFQITPLFFFILAGLTAYLSNRNNHYPITAIEFFFVIIVLLSLLTSFATKNYTSSAYTLALASILFSSAQIVRTISTTTIINVASTAAIFMIAIVFILNFQELLVALSTYKAHGGGLFRFKPLGMHPNLTGYVYGLIAILLLLKSLQVKLWKYKVTFALFGIISLIFVIAASARASLLAMGIVFIIWLAKFLSNLTRRQLKILVTATIVLTFILISQLPYIIEYLFSQLEFESPTRGLDSGGTGRTDLWVAGWNMILNDLPRFIAGNGFRTAEPNQIGISLESSYLTLTFEFGIISTVFFIGFLLLAIHKFLKSTKKNETIFNDRTIAAFLIVFAVTQSIFNRYLFSIGNFNGLLILLLILSAYVSPKMISQTFKNRTTS